MLSRWRIVWFGTFSCALLGMLLGIWAQTLRVSGESSVTLPDLTALGDVLAETSYGQGWVARLLLGALLLLTTGLFARLDKRWQWAILTFLSLAALLTISRTGHATGEPRRTLAVVTDFVHLSGASVWLGGLVSLVVALPVIDRFQAAENARTAALLVRRHSITSLAVMAVITATGAVSASFHVGGFRSLRTEDYGVTLLSKQGLLIVVLIAAAINLFVLRPRVFHFLRAQDLAGAWRQIRSIRYVALFEIGFATLILLATAVLTVVAPADYPLSVDVAAKAVLVDEHAAAGDLGVRLLAELRGDPLDQYTVAITAEDERQPAGLQRVIVESRLAEAQGEAEGLGDRFDAEPVERNPAMFAFPATRLGLEGEWTLNIVVRRAGLQDVEASFQVDTTGTVPSAPRLVEDTWRLPEMTLTAWMFVALAVVMMAVGLAGLRYLTGMEPVASGVLLSMCVLIAIGFIVSATRQTVPVSAGQDVQNPVEFGDVSIRQGSDLYFANCLLCHGAEGRGVDIEDSPHAHGEAADLNDRAARLQTDGDLYTWITNGVPATDMPAFDLALTDQERWRLVNYIRWLQGERP